jgi:predicted ATP-grasp superfamily ATP-dependent carboligase
MTARRGTTVHPGVTVFDADAPTAIAFTRSLGARGIAVNVFSPHRLSAAGSSRYCASSSTCPSLDEPEEFLPWLEQQFRRGSITCVAPTSDQVAFYLAELFGIVPQALARILPSATAVREALFKDRFHAALDRLGVASPVTGAPASLAEAQLMADNMRFPLVLKPRAHAGAGLARGTVVANQAELKDAFGPWKEDTSNRLVLARYPGLRLPLLQEYVPGALAHLYSVSGLIGPAGQLLAVSGSRKTAQWPPALGVGVRFEPWADEAVIASGAALATSILGRGLFELELIWDAQRGVFVAIDLNPRAHGQISLDIARGNDLPWLWYRLFRGETLSPAKAPLPGVHWRHALPFHASHLAHLASGPHRREAAAGYVNALKESAVDIVLRRDDVLPGLVYTARMLRHPGGLVRPFLH